jgi:hypothetical protein
MKTFLVVSTANSAIAENGYESYGIAVRARTKEDAMEKLRWSRQGQTILLNDEFVDLIELPTIYSFVTEGK